MTARVWFTGRFMRLSIAAASALALISGALAIPQQVGAQVSILSVAPYTQNFDGLASTGTNPWQNDTTLKGWYVERANDSLVSNYAASDGASALTGLFSFGSVGSSDRAFGFVTNSTLANVYYGVRLHNDTGTTISKFTVSYTGEQWRDGGGGNTTSDDIDFAYKTAATVSSVNGTGWVDANALDFDSPAAASQGRGIALDGNAAENRLARSATITLPTPLPADQEIMFRWGIKNHGGEDHGIGIDDLTITPTLGSPAPVLAECPTTVRAFAGGTQSAALSARDADGVVASVAADAALPTGVSIGNSVPAPAVGGTLTANLIIDSTATAGDFSVPITFSNQDTPAQTASCTVRVIVEAATADLTLRKDGPTSYRPNTQIVYTLTIASGADGATGLTLTDTLPNGVSYVSDDSGVAPAINGQTLSWNLPDNLAANSAKRIQLVTLVAAGTRADLVNQANVASTSTDPDLTNNTASSPIATQFLRAADFSNSGKTSSARTVFPGDTLSFTITISNSGDIAATYVLTDVLDDDLRLVDAPGMTVAGQQLTTTGSIAGGEQRQFVITTKVKQNGSGMVFNSATLSGDGQTRRLSSAAAQIRSRVILVPIVRK